WYGSDDERDNPPGYRKENHYDQQGRCVHEEHPRSTVTWKQKGIRHDSKNSRVRLSKGRNHKEYPRAREYILVEYETAPGVTVENLQQVRAVYDQAKGRWELHLVCKDEIETPTAPGNETAGIDLGICNFATVAYSTEDADLYPGNRLKQDGYYFPKEIAKCDDSSGERATRLHAKWSERRTHFFHSLAKHIVQRCIEKGVGRILSDRSIDNSKASRPGGSIINVSVRQYINVGDLEGVRENEDGESKNWGRHGNLDLHGWAFDRFTNILEYKAKVEGIEVVEVSERDTSKTCCICGREDDSQRVERGLYVCESCDVALNGDVNGAENIRLDINGESNSESAPGLGGDRSTGWLAQPGVYLYDLSSGFQPQAQVIPPPSGGGGCQ
ncbi:MAG: RNA-guided endonuclease InsQ/TnpB family protein, partial [Halobacteriales archaeon]